MPIDQVSDKMFYQFGMIEAEFPLDKVFSQFWKRQDIDPSRMCYIHLRAQVYAKFPIDIFDLDTKCLPYLN